MKKGNKMSIIEPAADYREAFAAYHSVSDFGAEAMRKVWDEMPEAERQEHIAGLEDW